VKKAFSLIELMIVIVIIGVVYTLAITKLQTVGETKEEPTLANLKEYLLSYMKEDVKNVKLLCLDDCSECDIYADDSKVATLKNFLDSSVMTYRYDFLQGAQETQEAVYFNKEDVQESVCFSLNVNRNRVADQVLVAFKDKVYDYTPYFEKTGVYDSLEDVVQKKEDMAQEVMQ